MSKVLKINFEEFYVNVELRLFIFYINKEKKIEEDIINISNNTLAS